MSEIRVTSVSGHNTCIEVPHLKTAFDIGICKNSAISMETVLITHGHMDHVGAIATHAARRQLGGMKPGTYLMHPDNIEGVEMIFNGFQKLGHETIPYAIVPIKPGEAFVMNNRREVRPFNSMHRIPCQGYAIWNTKKKLKPEFSGLTGPEIGALARRGVEVNEVTAYPEIAYTGDTLIDVVDHLEVVRTVKHLVIEVTFLDDKVPVKQARKWGHIHLDEIIQRAHLFENDRITFTHLSARYSLDYALELISQKLPNSLLERVDFMI